MTTEQILRFGPNAKSWLLKFFNKCSSSSQISEIERKAKVLTLMKRKKRPILPKEYQTNISAICILMKVYERLILGRISQHVDDQLTPDREGFRPGRSCCKQVLNLTQHIEDGFKKKLISCAVFVDLSTAYDTVNHEVSIHKISLLIKSTTITSAIQSLLTNRRFLVEMNGHRSRWRNQRNGLPQGSVLAPILFNIYTNDQPKPFGVRRFIYADDLCLATQSKEILMIEKTLSKAFMDCTTYYEQ